MQKVRNSFDTFSFKEIGTKGEEKWKERDKSNLGFPKIPKEAIINEIVILNDFGRIDANEMRTST